MTIEQLEQLKKLVKQKEPVTKHAFATIINGTYSLREESEEDLKLKIELAKKEMEEQQERELKRKQEELELKQMTSSEFSSFGYRTIGGYFKVEEGIYQLLRRNINKKVNTMLLGSTGIGKTELIWNIAKEMGIDVTVFDMGTMSDPVMSLIGVHTMKVVDGHTFSEFKPSRFSEVIQKPGIVLLDEISRSSPAANNLLFPCLDFRRELPMEYSFGNTEPIKIHPDCVFMSTANVGSQFTGTHKIDRALMDRFVPIEVQELDFDNTLEALEISCPALTKKQAKFITKIYFEVSKANKNYNCSFNLSFRHLKVIGKLVEDGFTVFDSYITVATGIASSTGKEEMSNIINQIEIN